MHFYLKKSPYLRAVLLAVSKLVVIILFVPVFYTVFFIVIPAVTVQFDRGIRQEQSFFESNNHFVCNPSFYSLEYRPCDFKEFVHSIRMDFDFSVGFTVYVFFDFLFMYPLYFLLFGCCIAVFFSILLFWEFKKIKIPEVKG